MGKSNGRETHRSNRPAGPAGGDDGFRLYAANVVGGRQEAMRKHIAGVRAAEDIEAVHQMRVASRRLRAALALFEPVLPADVFVRWQKQVRKVTRSLGAARDLDVQIAQIDLFVAEQTQRNCLPGVKRLTLRLKQRRSKRQRGVLRAMKRLEASRVLDDMSLYARQWQVRSRLEAMKAGGDEALAAAGSAIRERIGNLLTFEPFVELPDRISELHAMRIAAKRLRYCLEIFDELYDGRLKVFVKQVKRVQTLLGDIHDADVWIEMLPQFMAAEHRRTERYFGHTRGFGKLRPGIALLAADRQTQRDLLYQQFVQTWRTLSGEQTWQRMLNTAEGQADQTEDESMPAVEVLINPTDERVIQS